MRHKRLLFVVVLALGILFSAFAAASALGQPWANFSYTYEGKGPFPSGDANQRPECTAPCRVVADGTASDPSGIAWVQWRLTQCCAEPRYQVIGNDLHLDYAVQEAGGYSLELIAHANDGSEGGTSGNLPVVPPGHAKQPVTFLGPDVVQAPDTVMTVEVARPECVGQWSTPGGGGGSALEVVNRSGPVGGKYRYGLRIRQAPIGPVELTLLCQETVNGQLVQDQSDPIPVRVLSSRLPAFNGFGSKIQQGWTMKRVGGQRVQVYQARGFTEGYATKPHTCNGTLRLERKAKTGRSKKWRLLRKVPVKCDQLPRYRPQEFTATLATSNPQTYRQMLRKERLRLVYQVKVRSGGKVVYQAKRLQNVTSASFSKRFPIR